MKRHRKKKCLTAISEVVTLCGPREVMENVDGFVNSRQEICIVVEIFVQETAGDLNGMSRNFLEKFGAVRVVHHGKIAVGIV